MSTNVIWLKMDGDQLTSTLHEAREQLDHTKGELILDFSSINRIDAPGLRTLQELVSLGEKKSVKLVLRGVNIDFYKVLKLTRLASRVSFLRT